MINFFLKEYRTFLLIGSLSAFIVLPALAIYYSFSKMPMNCEGEISRGDTKLKFKLERLRTGSERVDNNALIEQGGTTAAQNHTITETYAYKAK